MPRPTSSHRVIALPFVGADKQVSATVFGMQKGEVSSGDAGRQSSGDRDGGRHQAAASGGVRRREAEVRDRYENEQAGQLVADRSKQAGDLLKSNGGDLKAVAKKHGLELKSTDFFDGKARRRASARPATSRSAFTKPAGTLSARQRGYADGGGEGGRQADADPAKLAQEREGILTQLKRQEGRGTQLAV